MIALNMDWHRLKTIVLLVTVGNYILAWLETVPVLCPYSKISIRASSTNVIRPFRRCIQVSSIHNSRH